MSTYKSGPPKIVAAGSVNPKHPAHQLSINKYTDEKKEENKNGTHEFLLPKIMKQKKIDIYLCTIFLCVERMIMCTLLCIYTSILANGKYWFWIYFYPKCTYLVLNFRFMLLHVLLNTFFKSSSGFLPFEIAFIFYFFFSSKNGPGTFLSFIDTKSFFQTFLIYSIIYFMMVMWTDKRESMDYSYRAT